MTTRMPVMFVFHGGGPCFFMDWDPPHAWDSLRADLEAIPSRLPEPPTAIVVVTAHWEDAGFGITSGAAPGLIYDYGGFPAHTYQLTYPAPGAPDVAARVGQLLGAGGVPHHLDPTHGWDHGVFIPLKVIYPGADVPVVAVSVERSFDPELHLAAGRALAPLRDEGVLIIGSGASTHNLRALGRPDPRFVEWDQWLNDALAGTATERTDLLANWAGAPGGRLAHPREEHLLPLMVVAGAAGDDAVHTLFRDQILGHPFTNFTFGDVAA
jgi:aromatic ring-opening dioxygenase catalytic subunit (LigB family)